MPKRAADKQLTDRNVDEDESEPEPTANGEFSKASAATIEKRQIKGLPGRRGNSNNAASPFASSSKSAGAPTPGSANGIGNGATPDETTEELIKQRGLNVSAQRAFGVLEKRILQDPFIDLTSSLHELWSRYDKARKESARRVKPPESQPASQPKAPAFAAWTGPAIPSAASKKKEEPPALASPAPPSGFSFGGQSVTAPSASSASSGSGGFKPVASTSAGPSTSPFDFAAPTASSSSFGASSSAQPASSCSTPSAPSTTATASLSAPVAFNTAVVAGAAPKKPSPLRQAETLLSSPVSSSTAIPGKSEPAKPPNPFSGFSFGASAKAAPSPFSFGVSPSPAATTAATSVPSTSVDAKDAVAKPVTPPKPLTSVFGGGKSGSPPSFGAAKFASQTSSAPSFGSANVGFSFGRASDAAMAPAPAYGGFGSTTPAFSFAAPAASTSALSAANSPAPSFGAFGSNQPVASSATSAFSAPKAVTSAVSDAGGDTTDAEADAAGPPEVRPGDSALLTPGAGEEDEETLFECRGRLYDDSVPRLAGEDNPGSLVNLKLKRHGTTGVKRLLARSEGNGKVLLNSRLFPGLAVRIHPVKAEDSRPGRTTAFMVAGQDGKLHSQRLRVRNEEVANSFKSAVAEHVASLVT